MNDNPFSDPSLDQRCRTERWFRRLLFSSLIFTLGFIVFFLFDMVTRATPALKHAYIEVEVTYTERASRFPRNMIDKELRSFVSRGWIRLVPGQLADNPEMIGTTEKLWVLTDDQVDQFLKGHHHNLKEDEQARVVAMQKAGKIESRWNLPFLSNGDSKMPELAGISSAAVGSVLTLIVTMAFAFPLGVATAIYLEEFARDSWISQMIEANINNLAAIPSILYGLLGLSVFINLFGLPRSSPLVGGLTLALMTLPIIIVSSRAALRSVPSSIRQAGYGLGLSKVDIVKDHVLPVAMPGILTGSIIGMAQAMGETAPLIIVGMIAFVPDSSWSFTEAATVLPAQIFTWAGMPERAFLEKTAAGILVMLSILVSLNGAAIYLRKRYEFKW
ncbi:MAG: phosphate ABC transporter permease PstA [Alcanivoracaceae bacterium]|jgi:phosphate transport system permease protein|nr:phosphate ABC transporter permease PstA [Alcanivoracaceae bacterium]